MISFRSLIVGLALLVTLSPIPASAVDESPTTKSAGAAHDSAGGGHGHDDTDVGHANATADLNNPAELRFELAVATFVVFLLLLALLGKFAWGPISKGLETRENHIAGMIADAERNQRDTELRLKELEARLAAQAEEAREALSAARREGEVIKERIVGEAHAAAQQETERSITEIRAAKNLALREIAQKSVNTAVDLAKSLIHREVRAEDHAQLISESLSQFKNN